MLPANFVEGCSTSLSRQPVFFKSAWVFALPSPLVNIVCVGEEVGELNPLSVGRLLDTFSARVRGFCSSSCFQEALNLPIIGCLFGVEEPNEPIALSKEFCPLKLVNEALLGSRLLSKLLEGV